MWYALLCSIIVVSSASHCEHQTFANNLWCFKSPLVFKDWGVTWNCTSCWSMFVNPNLTLHGVCQHRWTCMELVFSINVWFHGGFLTQMSISGDHDGLFKPYLQGTILILSYHEKFSINENVIFLLMALFSCWNILISPNNTAFRILSEIPKNSYS